jgi:hypothetical protein
MDDGRENPLDINQALQRRPGEKPGTANLRSGGVPDDGVGLEPFSCGFRACVGWECAPESVEPVFELAVPAFDAVPEPTTSDFVAKFQSLALALVPRSAVVEHENLFSRSSFCFPQERVAVRVCAELAYVQVNNTEGLGVEGNPQKIRGWDSSRFVSVGHAATAPFLPVSDQGAMVFPHVD